MWTATKTRFDLRRVWPTFDPMPLHLQKLCVGADSVDNHRAWIALRLASMKAAGVKPEQVHTTRTMPKRRDEILDGGSLYWVTRGVMQSRQRILDLRPVTGPDGITRCDIVLDPVLVLTKPRKKRPFQGWRYLQTSDAPLDLTPGSDPDVEAMPAEMRRELAELGLI